MDALTSSTTGASNTGMGFKALFTNTVADACVAVGFRALETHNVASSAETYNVAVGYDAGRYITTSVQNTFVGGKAGYTSVNGVQNTIVGYNSVAADATHSNTIVIGVNSTGKGSNTGFINANTGGIYQGDNSSDWSTTSDRRLKKNITTNTSGLSIINNIVVRNFEYKTAEEVEADGVLEGHNALDIAGQQVGVIAQELEEILPSAVVEESTGVKSVQSSELKWYLINAVKELSEQNAALTARIEALES